MHPLSTYFITALLLLLTTSHLPTIFTHAQSDTQLDDAPVGECTTACMTTHPTISHCTGDETTTLALERCRCASYKVSNDPQVGCVQQCPWEEQQAYARSLPALCGTTLFLWIDMKTGPRPGRENTLAAAGLPEMAVANTRGSVTSDAAGVVVRRTDRLGTVGYLAVGLMVVVGGMAMAD
ncbi:hypothetical protein A1O1_03400 [Capronia coronata CBS 617.96]|uniref:Extracellular membrane protein CFEM domain-containing protein n=1 Tax=Capronia coronata CBS 617.96 TaxID=1182541 RepID=W9YM35_9EURO|nr:uncharacterized protein A1O1_03400 [Capronia coronata CBS 617.96]EXJ90301.1 hypothetical protein A1O1_03400 [Capronia coronata CBS 617.96]